MMVEKGAEVLFATDPVEGLFGTLNHEGRFAMDAGLLDSS
jgi:hypothetical protein